jgi:hypothetical protein
LVRNLDGAISNARALAAEVISLLRPKAAEPTGVEYRGGNDKGGVMAEERASIFGDDDELDVSAFKPKPPAKRRVENEPPVEEVRAVSEAVQFQSRGPPLQQPLRREQRFD